MSTENVQERSQQVPIKTRVFVPFFMILLVLFFFMPSLLILLIVGMMPTLGAAISDPTHTKAQTYCVGFCNFAGLVPSLHELYLNNFSLSQAYKIIHSEYNLLFILGLSAIGWCLFFILPSITIGTYRARDKLLLIRMIKRYKDLKEIWGDAIPDSEILSDSKEHQKKVE